MRITLIEVKEKEVDRIWFVCIIDGKFKIMSVRLELLQEFDKEYGHTVKAKGFSIQEALNNYFNDPNAL